MPKRQPAPALFTSAPIRNRRVLILPRFLEEDADKQAHRDAGPALDNARAILTKWADLESKGRLKKKESALDANFLIDVFGTALRYTPVEQSAADGVFHLDRQLAVPGVGPVDGALGLFPVKDSANPKPAAVIELKGSDTDLDTDRFNGRTPVQQLFDYLNGLPETKWGIVSNFSTLRIYHKDAGSQTYEEFSLQKLKIDREHFHAFWCLLEKGGIIPTAFATARADTLMAQTGERKREVGDELYEHYSRYRNFLIATLEHDFAKPPDDAIRIAQRIFDRIIFIAFCQYNGLIRTRAIERAVKEVRAFEMVKNPRWQNFKSLFHFIDRGDPSIDLDHGYNGGLFNDEDDKSIAQLELPDEPWTNAFAKFANYDFRYEVSVDVLGHIFERSITELEKRRAANLFEKTDPAATSPEQPKMNKSAERKRFGIYYTPPEFTKFIVQQTVEELLLNRFKELEKAHGVTPDELAGDFNNRSPRLQAYYQQSLHTLRNFKIVDPACGSGAFLIAAYELLEGHYEDICRHLVAQGVKDADKLRDQIPDFILRDNLYGVDLSEEAVEITRLALWIRSARPGKTLADLTHNVVCGNSLVDDIAVHPRAMNWQGAFPEIFKVQTPPSRHPGFDTVIGNPPWERMKVQNKDFFSLSSAEIIAEANPAKSRKLIAELEEKDPGLYRRYFDALEAAEKISVYARSCGRFQLTARGDINTYMLFAELARELVAPLGRVGLLVPSGIATDDTTKDFFGNLIETESLVKFYDFENREGIFPEVDGRFKFCTLILGGAEVKTAAADFVFFAHSISNLGERSRHIPLTKKDIARLNPNTKTCPIFRSRRDADITKELYRKVPVLIDESRASGGNPWSITYRTLFHQSASAELFNEPKELQKRGLSLKGNIWSKGKQRSLPLYEAKMIQAYDHRAASVSIQAMNWVRQGQTIETTPVEHQNPEHFVIPRWWIDETSVIEQFPRGIPAAFIGFKNVTSSTNQRTMSAAFLPVVAVIDSAPLILFDGITPVLQSCLLANLNSIPFDYIARQKVGGNHLSYFIVNQLPALTPDAYVDKTRWTKKQTLEQWISERVLKLSCTANDMIPLAKACNFHPPSHVWKWKEQERAELRAQLDAAYFHLYGISRDDAAYILSTFQTSGSTDAGNTIEPHSTAQLILSYYDDFASA